MIVFISSGDASPRELETVATAIIMRAQMIGEQLETSKQAIGKNIFA
jgi:hypothetical protein